MYFNVAATADGPVKIAISGAADRNVAMGRTKIATVTCAEATACKMGRAIWAREAKGAGFDLVYPSDVLHRPTRLHSRMPIRSQRGSAGPASGLGHEQRCADGQLLRTAGLPPQLCAVHS